jgi:8-oxo-dGTP diphosphatase
MAQRTPLDADPLRGCNHRKNSQILIGFRAIAPYRNVWALPGGRILKDENPHESVRRNLKEISISAEIRELVGVFSVRFPNHPQRRHDLSLCYRTSWRSGVPNATSELTRFKWISPRQIPLNMGTNYKRMIRKAFPL